MLTFTRHELDGFIVVTAVTVIVHILASALVAWLQERENTRLRDRLADLEDDVDEMWEWCRAAAQALGWGDGGPDEGDDDSSPDQPDLTPPGDELEPDTVISHPADLFARKAALLDRYVHIGQHRT